MRKISSRDVPSWFNLDRYSACDSFDLRDWYHNLIRRALIYNQTDFWLEEFGRYWETDVDKTLAAKSHVRNCQKLEVGKRDQSNESGEHFSTPTVKPIELYFPVSVMLEVSKKSTPFTDQIKKAVKKLDNDSSDDELDAFLGRPIDDQDLGIALVNTKMDLPLVHAEIDLAAADELILNDMKRWLGAARKRYGLPEAKIFSAAEQRKWKSLQILAYLDLSIWAKVDSLLIPYAVMGNALFPDQTDIDIVDRVRRVVRPKAEMLMNFDTMEIMQRQVRHPA